MKKYLFLFYLLFPIILFASFAKGGIWIFSLIIFIFVGIPVLDIIFGVFKYTFSSDNDDDGYFNNLMYIYIPVHIGLVVGGAGYISSAKLSTLESWIFTLSTGLITGGIGITVAHELCHRKDKLNQFLSDILLSFVCYTHFSTEHVFGHHKRVSTPEDPASARLGESVYAFWFRSVVGSFKSASEINKKKLKREGKSFFSLSNRILMGIVYQILIAVSLYLLFGGAGLRFFIIQSFFAFTLLELVNYVEHYGLQRKEVNGRYSKILPKHSWNNSNLISNLFLFNLQRHSHHHADGNVHYQYLKHYEDAPQLPAGYPTMILLALIPPLWRKVIDPKVHALSA